MSCPLKLALCRLSSSATDAKPTSRLHSALGYLSPAEFEEKMGEEQATVSVAS